jgi:hypothetical protein
MAAYLPDAGVVPFLIYNPPTGPDGVAHDDVHAPRRNAQKLRRPGVALISGQEQLEDFSHLLRLGLIEETMTLLVPDTPRQHDFALR